MTIRSITHPSDQEVEDILWNLPKPCRDYTSDGDTRAFRQIDWTIDFWTKTGTYGWELGISISPSGDRGHTLVIHNHASSSLPVEIPLTIENTVKGIHSIDVQVNGVRFRVCEHILAVLQGLSIYGSKIEIDTKNWGLSWPTEVTSVSEYTKEILDNSSQLSWKRTQDFTVGNPTKIEFDNSRGSSVLLLPANGSDKTVYDVNVDYPQSSIWGKRRIKFEQGNTEAFCDYISQARSSSRSWKNIAMRIPRVFWSVLQTVPIYWQEIPIGIDRGTMMEIYRDRIGHPNEVFMRDGYESWEDYFTMKFKIRWEHKVL